jgi:probable rRNA maturation factor
LAIDFFNEDVEMPDIQIDGICSWIIMVIEIETFTTGDVSIIFCNDSYLLKINREYLGHDYFTDIITFDYSADEVISGDLFISVDTVSRNSVDYGTGFSNELLRVIIHGVLHLMGYKDKAKKDIAIMRKKENEYLNMLELLC